MIRDSGLLDNNIINYERNYSSNPNAHGITLSLDAFCFYFK